MGYKINSALAALVLLAVYYFHRRRWGEVVARQHGCQPPVKYRSFEPLGAFDFQISIHTDVPSLARYHLRYGKSFKVGSLLGNPAISTIATENLHTINAAGKDWGIEPLRLPAMEYFCGRGFLTTDGTMWQHSRKLLKPTFSRANLLDLTPLVAEVDQFLQDVPGDGSTIDLQPMLFKIFLNTSLRFLLGGNPTNGMEEAPISSETFINAFHDALFGTGLRVMLGRAGFLAPKAQYLNGCKVAHEFLDFYVNQALVEKLPSSSQSELPEPGKIGQRSMIQGLAAQTDDRHYIRSQILQGMMAAQETTSALLGNTLFLLSRHPSNWQQIRSEALQKGQSLLTFDALSASKPIQNVLLESLRLFPIFPLLGRTALNDTKLPVGGGTDQNDPIFVPKGSMVVMSSYALHRDPSVFGNDVESFNPDRWNDIHPGQWEFMPFGGGQRACMGQQKVFVEAAYLLVRMTGTFETLESRDNAEWKGELKLTCKNANGCKVALHRGSKALD